MSFRRLGSGLPGMVSRWIDDDDLRDGLVRLAWRRAGGEAIAAHTRVRSFEDGVLRIGVVDAAWTKTLRGMQSELMGRLVEELGGGVVRQIEWLEESPDPGSGKRATAS